MTTPATSPHTKSRTRRPKADTDAAANNPDILCHQIGLCKNLAELQSFIAKHNLLDVETDERFSPRMRVVIDAALDTMTEVLSAPPLKGTADLFIMSADLARQGWWLERDGVTFRLRKGRLATDGYVILGEAFEAARKLQQREGKRKGAQSTPSPEAASGDEVASTAGDGEPGSHADSDEASCSPTPSPFLCPEMGPNVETVDTVGRLARIKTFGPEELRQVIALPGVQVTVRIAAERRLKKLEKDQQAAAPATNGDDSGGSTIDADGEASSSESEPTIYYVDPARLDDDGDIASSVSVQGLSGKVSKINKPFEHDGELYVGVGAVGTGTGYGWSQVDAVRVVPLDSYEDETYPTYNAKREALGRDDWSLKGPVGYDGVLASYQKNKYVLAGPEVTFKPSTAAPEDASASAVPAADGDVVGHTPAPDAAPETRTFKRVVEVKLNDHDIADKARKAALLNLQIEELEAEKDSTAKTYKKKIDGLEEERDKLMREIRAGRDELELEVFERRDYDRHVVELRRADSCEFISERPMRPTEYQQRLPAV
ncbi:MAG TPA: hypothetical protein VGB98_00130 [Pyrinomonadaceae bacterium]|jgi:hypothetical protein